MVLETVSALNVYRWVYSLFLVLTKDFIRFSIPASLLFPALTLAKAKGSDIPAALWPFGIVMNEGYYLFFTSGGLNDRDAYIL